MLNLAVMLEDSARAVPDRTALVLGEQRTSYAELDTAARKVANLLRSRGIRPGDKVALSCPNLPWFPIVYYGILKAGAVVVPLNVLLKGREIAYHLADSGAKAYFCFEGTAELPLGREGFSGFGESPDCEHFFLMTAAADSPVPGAETLTAALADHSADFETVPTSADDTAVILYTSGTTGRPKGAELTHANMALNALTCHKLFGEAEHDIHLVTLPLFHSFGQTVQMNAGLAGRSTLVLLPAPLRRLRRPRPDGAPRRHLLRRRAHHVLGPARRGHLHRRPGSDRRQPAHRRLRRRRAPGGDPPPLRRAVQGDSPGGVRPVGDQPGRHLLPARGGGPSRLHRAPRLGRGGGPGRRGLDPRRGPRHRRRDRHPRPQRHEGLPRPPRRHRRGDPRRLVPHRRPGPPRRRRLVLHRRPGQGPDHPRRLQRLPAGGRRSPAHPSRGEHGRGHRCPPRPARRRGQGLRRTGPRCRTHRGRTHRLVQAEDGELQVPAPGRIPRHPAHQRHREDLKRALRDTPAPS